MKNHHNSQRTKQIKRKKKEEEGVHRCQTFFNLLNFIKFFASLISFLCTKSLENE